jgi:hypothetical protein
MDQTCSQHPAYRGGRDPVDGCAVCASLYAERHPLCLCGCGDRVKIDLTRRPSGKFASPECRARYVAAGGVVPSDETITERGDERIITKRATREITSLDDLVKVCQIDLARWDVVEWSCKASQQYSVPRATRPTTDKKWVRPSNEPVLSQMFHVSAKLRKRSRAALTFDTLRADLLADIRAEAKRGPILFAPTRRKDDGFLFEFPPFDLHMGKYAWAEETVTNYDVDAAEDLFRAALDYQLNRALRLSGGTLERVLCVFGNDVSHIDSKKGQTTAGTPMDVDTRYIRVFRRICAVHRHAVKLLRSVAPVDVVIVPGNHDELTAFHLGEILDATFDGDKFVTVDNSAKLRKYYRFGINLLGFSHGDGERVAELPLTMAREVPHLWAAAGEREFHIGHLHIKEEWNQRQLKSAEQEGYAVKGVRIRRLSSLSAHDAWHTKHAYMDRRACDAFLFHKDAGFTAALSFNVDHFSGQPAEGQRIA